ncbi:MAG: hypothetical protein Q8S41_09305 [Lutibacter sp.]|nr:hypothetical protein [Lutibacter sp.]
MSNLEEILFGKESSRKMTLFFERIKFLNEKYCSELENDTIENKFIINGTAGQNINCLQFRDDKLETVIVEDVKKIFNNIFSYKTKNNEKIHRI